jgi:opacity protein-like surface antigen
VDVGAELRLPLPAAPWIRAGLVGHSLHYRAGGNVADVREGEQTSGAGFSAGGGVELRVGRRLSVTPGVRYVRYGAADRDGVALLVGDVGLKIRM